MNLLDHHVTKVLSAPVSTPYGWKVEVEVDCWGRIDKSYVMSPTLQEAEAIDVGYTYLA